MRSCCHNCEHVAESKDCRRCVTCTRRLALLDRLDYLAQDRRRDGEAYAIGASLTRRNGQPETWAG